MAAAKANIYEMVTARIIAEFEKGNIPWEKPWTGVRSGAYNRISKKAYSKEELVAEIGSASLMNLLGIETVRTFRNSAAYIQSWLKVLKSDNKFIVSASSKAEKAVNYIIGE